MSYTQKALVMLLAILILPGLFMFFAYRPKAGEYERLQLEKIALREKIIEANTKLEKIPQAREEIKNIKEKLQRLEKQYPATIEPFYKLISSKARKVGMDILSITSVEQKTEEENLAVGKHYIQVDARSSYRVLAEFLFEISHLPVTVSISHLEIEGDRRFLPDLDIEMILVAYLTKEQS